MSPQRGVTAAYPGLGAVGPHGNLDLEPLIVVDAIHHHERQGVAEIGRVGDCVFEFNRGSAGSIEGIENLHLVDDVGHVGLERVSRHGGHRNTQ